MTMKRLTTGVACVGLALGASALEITKDFAIVVPEPDKTGVSRALETAGRELANDIRESTGLELKVVKAKAAPTGRPCICIGAPFAAAAGLMPQDRPLRAMENVIAEKDGNVYLFGNDRPGQTNPKSPLPWQMCVLPSVKATTTFMENYMGVAFLSPGRTGRDVPARAKIEIPDGTRTRFSPTQEAGPGRYHEMMTDIANGIYGSGMIQTYGGHTYLHAVPMAKYRKDHPEYFPLTGKERAQQNAMGALCISNPDVERLLAEFLVKALDAGASIVQLGQNDGYDHCLCEQCANYGGVKGDLGEQLWIFHRRIAERVYKERPNGTVQIISYGATAQPPKTFTEFSPNVMIEMMNCSEQSFRLWKKYKVPRGFTNYVYLWGTYDHPGHTAKCSFPYMAQMARRYLDGGIKAVYRCGYGELYGTEGPAYYVFNCVLQDPSVDEKAVFESYSDRAYGPAAKPMKAFHALQDLRVRGYNRMKDGFEGRGAAVRGYASVSEHAPEVIAYMYPPDVLEKMEKQLSLAEKTANLTEKQVRRLKLVRMEFNYLKNLATVIHLYHGYLSAPSRELFLPLADALRARNAMLDSFYDAKGRMKPIDGWWELKPFQGHARREMQTNGHLRAKLGAPFAWDADAMLAKGVLPGSGARSADVVRAVSKPTLGDFESGAWAAAKWIDTNGIQLEKLTDTTRFKLLYDDANFYVAVSSTYAPKQVIKASGRDSSCFRQDNIDMLVDPTGTRERHFHFIWNAIPNSYYDGACGLIEDPLDPRFGTEDSGYDCDWTYETEVRDGIWRSLVTIPYASLKAEMPKPGDTWCFNLGRMSDTLGKGDVMQVEQSLWSPNMENRKFTSPEAMGTLTFK